MLERLYLTNEFSYWSNNKYGIGWLQAIGLKFYVPEEYFTSWGFIVCILFSYSSPIRDQLSWTNVSFGETKTDNLCIYILQLSYQHIMNWYWWIHQFIFGSTKKNHAFNVYYLFIYSMDEHLKFFTVQAWDTYKISCLRSKHKMNSSSSTKDGLSGDQTSPYIQVK